VQACAPPGSAAAGRFTPEAATGQHCVASAFELPGSQRSKATTSLYIGNVEELLGSWACRA
jgi:hypothetical protein